MFSDVGTDDFFINLDRVREANRFMHQLVNASTERQGIAHYALRADLASQIFLRGTFLA